MKESSVCEEHVYNAVYEEHSQYLYNFAYYKCGDTAKAEDIVQEAFIRLWNNCAKVIFEKSKAYLFTVANNLFLNHVQHQKVRLNYQRQATSTSKTNENPEFLMEEKQFMHKLEAAISELTEAQREVFLMNRIDGLTYKTIAETLNISQKAVEKRMHKALVQLREKIGNI
ncbi:RNA polymerase sigma-70 factor [Winogradskyella sp. 3972H.M.0a.05]|uniref:RNA polymerase sigma factor n=1 Tax=Winogradskyella sp. 3972H.M.0a.05 TaxID=2950277 RepID=UPI003394E886